MPRRGFQGRNDGDTVVMDEISIEGEIGKPTEHQESVVSIVSKVVSPIHGLLLL